MATPAVYICGLIRSYLSLREASFRQSDYCRNRINCAISVRSSYISNETV